MQQWIHFWIWVVCIKKPQICVVSYIEYTAKQIPKVYAKAWNFGLGHMY